MDREALVEDVDRIKWKVVSVNRKYDGTWKQYKRCRYEKKTDRSAKLWDTIGEHENVNNRQGVRLRDELKNGREFSFAV